MNIPNERIRLEFIYAAQFTRPSGGGLEYTDNIFRLNVKVGLAKGLIRRLFDGGDADD